MTSLFFGLLTALGWGVGDYLSGALSRSLGYYRLFFYMQGFSIVLLAVWIAVAPLFGIIVAPPVPTVESVIWGIGLGVLELAAWLLLLRAFAIGSVAVVAPITSSLGAVALILSLLWGDPISSWKIVGLVVTAFGVALTSLQGSQRSLNVVNKKGVSEEVVTSTFAIIDIITQKDRPPLATKPRNLLLGAGVVEAIGSALAFGVTLWGQRFVVPALGPYWASEILTTTTWLLLVVLAYYLHKSLDFPRCSSMRRILSMAGCYTIAGVTFNLGLSSDSAGVIAVISSLSSPITIMLALVFLKERLTSIQLFGIGLIVSGLVLIS